MCKWQSLICVSKTIEAGTKNLTKTAKQIFYDLVTVHDRSCKMRVRVLLRAESLFKKQWSWK